MSSDPAKTPANPSSPRTSGRFGRFELRRLLGKSAGTMVWLAFDPRAGAETMLTLPRVQPVDAAALAHWLREVRLGARLNHPNLAPVAEVGVQDHWPFVAVDRACGVTLGEWFAAHPAPPPADVVGWVGQALRGLAFAHDAGVAHLDPQLHGMLVDERGGVALMALGAAGDAASVAQEAARARSNERTLAMDPGELRARRASAARDLLACGVLLHHLLTGQPALDQADTALVLARMAPLGREIVRLPWSTPLPMAEALRAIANRCTSGQERLRYQTTRSLLAALTGWLDAQAEDGGGPVALLLDRLHTVGHLPALPGLAARVAKVTQLESQRTDEIAEQVLVDVALSFELLRTLNTAQVQGTQVQGNGPVLTLRRIISLIGVNGVRLAANTLRPWPGPLSAPDAAALQLTFDRVRWAGHTAQALRPAGYDPQVVYLIAVLQNLGRLMLRYHFADEAAQIDALMQAQMQPQAQPQMQPQMQPRMQPLPPAAREPGASMQPGLSEAAAACAVIGVDVEALGTAVADHWGLGDDVMHMARRLPATLPVRRPDSDAETLRLVASAANDAVDAASTHAGPHAAAALAQIAQRYGRALGFHARDLSDALAEAKDAMRESTAMPVAHRGEVVADEGAGVASVEAMPLEAAAAAAAR